MSNDKVQRGQRLSARLWNALAAMVRRGTPLAGRGINITQTPAGSIIEAAGSPEPDRFRCRVVSVNGDTTGTFSPAYASQITYGVRIPRRPDLGVVTFGPQDKIMRFVHADEFKVWPMPIGSVIVVIIDQTDDAQKPRSMTLLAFEAPGSEPCATGGASP